jgi:hypothetical protein
MTPQVTTVELTRSRERPLLVVGSSLGTSVTALWGGRREARDPGTAQALIDSLAESDPLGYAAVCGALADFDVRDLLGEIATPVLTIAGSADLPTPPALLRELADGVQHGRYAELPGVGHLAPAEAPAVVAQLITRHSLISSINQSMAFSFLSDIDRDS